MGVYWDNMPQYKQQNFWNHKKELSESWYTGETGIPPLDGAIKESSAGGIRMDNVEKINNSVPLGQKIAFGFGMLANQLFPALLSIFIVVLIQDLGFNPLLYGIIAFVPRFIDAMLLNIEIEFIHHIFQEQKN